MDRIIEECFNLSSDQKEGCLFVVETENIKTKYYKDYNTDIYKKNGKKLSVLNKKDKTTIKLLAGLDGAMIINKKGELVHYGATLINSDKFVGHGKRHAFALGTSKKINGVVSILASEEDKHIRAFKNGACIFDIDSNSKLTSSKKQIIADVLATPLSKTLIASGIATSVLTLNPLPAIITISGSYVIVSEGFDRIKKIFNKKS
ncbi:MAG: diadenylate cyclase [Candidatus Micrarchaeia archaeon]